MFNFLSGPDVGEITSQQLEEKISSDTELLILDVRSGPKFKKEKIDPGNGKIFNFSGREILKGLPEEVNKTLSNQEVIVVCYKGNISQKVAAKLDGRLQNDVKSLEKGMAGWRKL